MSDDKLVAILNKRLDPGVALNAAAHMAIGLGARVATEPGALERLALQNYADADGGSHPHISGLSLIVLRASESQLRRAREQLLDVAFVVDFHEGMTGGDYRDQLARSLTMSAADLNFFGVCALGRRDELDPITKRLSLWR